MASTARSAFLIVSLVLAPALALAGPCDAFFAFDGNLVDSSGSGHDGRMVGAGGTPAEPEFVDGRSGQALRLNGESAMRTLLDLHPDACPQVTITAWVNIPSGGYTEGHIVSTEGQHGPALRIFGNSVHLVGAKGIVRRDALYADTWNFVALVYDSESALYRLHFGNRTLEAPMGDILFEPGPATWIGAYDQRMRYAPKGIVVDELRIIGAALDEQRIAALRDSTGSGNADAVAQSSGSSLVPGTSCSSTAQCPADSYCAVDRTCHPNSHLPMTASGSIGTGPRDIESDPLRGSVDYDSPTDLLQDAGSSDGDGESSRLSPESEQALTDFMAENRPPEIEYESEEAALAAAERREQERAENESSSDTVQGGFGAPGGMGSLTVRERLAQIEYPTTATGNVRDCTSFSEAVRDLATNIRDSIVEVAANAGCSLLNNRVAEAQVAAYVEDTSVYETMEFEHSLLEEVYDQCIATTTAASQLPDKIVGFWNSITGSDTWATIGPRKLLVGRTQSGNLVAPFDRKFVTPAPVRLAGSEYDGTRPLTLTLKELDGRARVTARVCTVTPYNHYDRLLAFSVNETPEERQDQSQHIVYSLNNVRWQYLIVYLDGAGRPGQNFKYELTIE